MSSRVRDNRNAVCPGGSARIQRLLAAGAAAIGLVLPVETFACSVCFGDPDSDMAKGAVSGVLFMIGVISCVLVGIASVAGVWIVRARRLARQFSGAPVP